jgi:type II secretion system protein H
MRRHASNLTPRPAFTLLELVLVMLVLTLITGLVVPALRNFSRGRNLGYAATQITAMANYAHTQAISQGKPYRLNLDVNNGTYWLTARTYDVFEDVRNEPGGVRSLPDEVRMECDLTPQQDGLYVEFRPNGRCDPGTLRLRDNEGNVREVICESTTEQYHIADTN